MKNLINTTKIQSQFTKRIQFCTLGGLILLVVLSNLPANFVSSYWGEGDDNCMAEHGLSTMDAEFVNKPEISIDGKLNEDVWAKADPYLVPMASDIREPSTFFVSYMDMKTFHDGKNLYISATWNDTDIDIHDMFAICWDMNCTNYTSQMLAVADEMSTPNPGEYVDTWHWINNLRSNGSTNQFLDDCFNHEGWIEDSDADRPSSNYGYIYGDLKGDGTNWYQLEIKRPLKTGDSDYDLQFEEGGTYRFASAVWDKIENEAHAISWTWELTLMEGENAIPGYDIYPLLCVSLIGLIYLIGKKKTTRNKN